MDVKNKKVTICYFFLSVDTEQFFKRLIFGKSVVNTEIEETEVVFQQWITFNNQMFEPISRILYPNNQDEELNNHPSVLDFYLLVQR